MQVSRREFVVGAGAVAAAGMLRAQAAGCPFRVSVITDEIGKDFDHACYVAAKDFGLKWVEIRTVNGVSLEKLDATQTQDALKVLAKYDLKVTDLASPLFKSDFPGAPLSKESPNKDAAKIPTSLQPQEELLAKLMEVAKTFKTERIRCFDFWRQEDVAPYRNAMNAALDKAATTCKKNGLILVLENEMACNTGSGTEAATLLAAVPNPGLMLNWDPGNSGTFPGDVPYPNDYAKLPKNRIGHVHVKSVSRTPGEKRGFEWQPVGKGDIDWVGQFIALKRDGYHYAVSLETHWHGGPGTTKDEISEASTRISMKGMKEALAKAGC